MDTNRNRYVDRTDTGSKSNRTRDWILQSHDGRNSISEHQPTNTTHHINRNVYTGETRIRHGNRDGLHTGKHIVDVLYDEEFFKQKLEAIVDLASDTLGNHDFKILKIAKDIECMKLAIDADDSDVNSALSPLLHEISAKEDKHMEFEKQRQQYISYLKRKRDTLKHMYMEKEFRLLNNILQAFGIECRRLQSALPIYARREEIVQLVINNQVCVIIGETGSGKSTQLVQYLYHAGIAGDHLIACTQPRKIAAISLATYVSSELASSVGKLVGYQVGMKSRKSSFTRLMYMTDHTLLNECLHDELLDSYSCIIIDEAHERSIYTDLLLGMLKAAMQKRPELKVIVTSATINPETFVTYFGGAKKCPVMYVSGRTYPVQDVFDESESNPFPDDYEIKAVNKAIDIHKNVPLAEGDILVFLTSPLEVDKCCERFRKRVPTDDHICLPLYGSLQVEEQQLVFKIPAEGQRKIVFATNCAETSITIPGIKHVIDTGVAKEMRFDTKKNMNTLSVVAISQSSADQRKGRAGRTAPGVCYRLYKETDFQTMDKMGKPEILRVHLGQGLLTLLELGVNPISFDFVESPSAEAMENAMHSLQCIGAVSDTKITDLGKWIAKLQVEPRLGIIIKHGIDNGIPVEGIVIAACCTSSGIFFRAGSDEDKKKADLKKLKFCHKGGDLLSMLNAYREWRMIGEKSKGIWCRSNSINGKAMKSVNDMVNEILTLLRKTMTLDITSELSTCEHVDSTVQKLIFQCMKWNICGYLGHEKAGYLTCDTHQPVRIHPSSSLMSLGVNHKWVVFSQIIQTSDSFITNVTPVTDADVEQALTDNMICLDKDTIESSKVGLAANITLGPFAQRKIIGAMHRNRRQLETKISAAFNDTLIILDWDKDTCQMELYCRTEYTESARKMFIDELAVVTEPLITESREECIGLNADGTRAVIQAGLTVRDILEPSQYRCIHVKIKLPAQNTISEDDLERMMHSYGEIECVRVAHENRFLATFCNAADAMYATCSVNADENSEIVIVPEIHIEKKYNTLAKNKSNVGHVHTSKEEGFTLRASWCRRPSKGFCYVHLNNPDDEVQLLNAADILLTQHHIRIKKNAKGELMLHDLGADVDENVLVQSLANAINVTLERNDKRIRVVIPRENVPANMNETSNIRQRFTDHISESTGNNTENCRIDIKEYKAQTARNTAFLRFRNVDDCQAAADCLASGFRINMLLPHTEVSVTLELRSSIHIHRAIFAVIKEEFDLYMAEKMEHNSKTTFVSKVLNSGHTIIDIKSESLTKLAQARQTIQRFIEGDTIDDNSSESVAPMFSKSGRCQVQQIEKKCYCVIFMNQRTQTLNIHGPVAKRQMAADMIRSFLNQSKNAGKNEKQICLKGKDNPPGLMKTLIMKYRIDLDVLRQECDLLAVSLNVRTHVVTLLGSDENVARAVAIIDEIKSDISSVATGRDDQAECPICLCPVDLEDVSRLEYCGHPYCSFCLTTLVQNAIQDKSFPIECAADGCGKPLVIKDINSQIKQRNVTMKSIATASLECFVTKNNSKFRYCLTPDCPMVYRLTTDGTKFSCSQCQTNICTTCHVQYHEGVTCEMYKNPKSELDLFMECMKGKQDIFKLCPKCKTGIEKNGGCNRVSCLCGAHICWVCMEYFPTCVECYSHLKDKHGSYF